MDRGDRILRMKVTATSPDGRVTASTKGSGHVELAFKDEAKLNDYTEISLAQQIEEVLDRVRRGKRKGIRAAYIADGKEYRDPNEQTMDAPVRRYRNDLDALEVVSQSKQGNVRIMVVGDRAQFRVKIRPGCLEKLRTDQVLAELNDAHAQSVTHHRSEKGRLKLTHFPR